MRTTLELMRLLDFLSRSPKTDAWVVALYPTTEAALEAGMVLAALAGDVPFSGRTAQFPWGRFSVVAAEDLVFVPKEVLFGIAFLGWAGEGPGEGLAQWRSRAAHTVRAV